MNRREFLRRSVYIGLAVGLPVVPGGVMAEKPIQGMMDPLSRDWRVVFGRAVFQEVIKRQSFSSRLISKDGQLG